MPDEKRIRMIPFLATGCYQYDAFDANQHAKNEFKDVFKFTQVTFDRLNENVIK